MGKNYSKGICSLHCVCFTIYSCWLKMKAAEHLSCEVEPLELQPDELLKEEEVIIKVRVPIQK